MQATGIAAAAPGAAAAQGGRIVSGTDGNRPAAARAAPGPADQAFCYGYIMGVADQLSMEGAVCLPAQYDQVTALARSHLAASGADRNRHATFLIGRVLKATYPCRR